MKKVNHIQSISLKYSKWIKIEKMEEKNIHICAFNAMWNYMKDAHKFYKKNPGYLRIWTNWNGTAPVENVTAITKHTDELLRRVGIDFPVGSEVKVVVTDIVVLEGSQLLE